MDPRGVGGARSLTEGQVKALEAALGTNPSFQDQNTVLKLASHLDLSESQIQVCVCVYICLYSIPVDIPFISVDIPIFHFKIPHEGSYYHITSRRQLLQYYYTLPHEGLTKTVITS